MKWETGKRQPDANFLTYELASGNWQLLDVNTIWEGFLKLQMNRQLANGSRMPIRKYLWIGNMATGS